MSAKRKYQELRSFTAEEKKTLRKKLRQRSVEDPETKCLIWQGCVGTQSKYGMIADPRTGGKRPRYAHHMAAELAGKVQPNVYCFDGSFEWQLHHTCRRRLCTNPKHLVWLTSKQHYAEHAPDRHAAAGRRKAAKEAAQKLLPARVRQKRSSRKRPASAPLDAVGVPATGKGKLSIA